MSSEVKVHKDNKENKSYEINLETEEEEMPKKPVSRHYGRKRDAERNRRKGERIYHDRDGYYIRRPQTKKSFWEELFGL